MHLYVDYSNLPFFRKTYTTFFSDNVNFFNSYTSSGTDLKSSHERTSYLLQETTDNMRFLRLMNPVFKYDFKVGNYLSDDTKKMNLHLFRTIQDVTTGVRKSS